MAAMKTTRTLVRLALAAAVSLFIAEVAVMYALPLLPPLPAWATASLDATLLLVLFLPALHYIAFRPLLRYIGKHERAEEALRKWANIFEHAGWGLAAIGVEDAKTLGMMNPAYARMHQYTVEELMGRPVADVFAPECRAELPEHIRVRARRVITSSSPSISARMEQSFPS